MNWLNKNGEGLQAIATIVTALVALIALAGVKIQIDSSKAIQQAQSAKEIYREFLSLSIQHPQFAEPDFCKLTNGDNSVGYQNFVGYMLYTSEQVMDMSREWQPVVSDLLDTHKAAICHLEDLDFHTSELAGMLHQFQRDDCNPQPSC